MKREPPKIQLVVDPDLEFGRAESLVNAFTGPVTKSYQF
jgi:hypothetical protein